MNRLTPAQLHANAEALHALADGKQIQYYSPVLAKWCDCEDVCMEFEHRVKPEEKPDYEGRIVVHFLNSPSLDVNDY